MACKNHNNQNCRNVIIALILNHLTLLTQRYVHIVCLYQRKNVTDETVQIKSCKSCDVKINAKYQSPLLPEASALAMLFRKIPMNHSREYWYMGSMFA